MFVLEDKWDCWLEEEAWTERNKGVPLIERLPRPKFVSKYTLTAGITSRDKVLSEEGMERFVSLHEMVKE